MSWGLSSLKTLSVVLRPFIGAAHMKTPGDHCEMRNVTSHVVLTRLTSAGSVNQDRNVSGFGVPLLESGEERVRSVEVI